MLQLLKPKLEALHALTRQHDLIEAVREIAAQDEPSATTTIENNGISVPAWLSSDYAHIATHAEQIQKVSHVIVYSFSLKAGR
jgi:hypothetical protein